jgi:hypothetical protein
MVGGREVSPDFSKRFEMVGELQLPLPQDLKWRRFIHRLRLTKDGISILVWGERVKSLLDYGIFLFDTDGKPLSKPILFRSIAYPDQIRYIRDFFPNSGGEIWLCDLWQKSVEKWSKEGKKISEFFYKGPEDEKGRFRSIEVRSIVVSGGKVYLGGKDNLEGKYIHVFNRTGGKRRSFFKPPEDWSKAPGEPFIDVRLSQGIDSSIWVAYTGSNRVYGLDKLGRVLHRWQGRSKLYLPPKPFAGIITPKTVEKWDGSWSQVADFFPGRTFGGVLVFTLAGRPGWGLEIFDPKGQSVSSFALPAEYRLLAVDEKDRFWFEVLDLSEKEKSTYNPQILVCEWKSPRREK